MLRFSWMLVLLVVWPHLGLAGRVKRLVGGSRAVVVRGCSLTRDELRATKLSYEGCGVEVVTSPSQELQPGDKVTRAAHWGHFYRKHVFI